MIKTSRFRARELELMADQIDQERYGYGFASAALREYANLIRAGIPKDLAVKVELELPKNRSVGNG